MGDNDSRVSHENSYPPDGAGLCAKHVTVSVICLTISDYDGLRNLELAD
jgi:hypothetical protein